MKNLLPLRIIPCLDIMNNKVAKGISFKSLEVIGDPTPIALKYEQDGADELVFLDIKSTVAKRDTAVQLVRKIAEILSIPFTVGGGVQSIDMFERLLKSGADKVAVNTAAIQNPNLVSEAARLFGTQCVVIAIDVVNAENSWIVYSHAGSRNTGIDIKDWVKNLENLGAGELLVTSINQDGKQTGYDIELYRTISENSNLPIIASGGAGSPKHIVELAKKVPISGALLASILHYNKYTISDIKTILENEEIYVRK